MLKVEDATVTVEGKVLDLLVDMQLVIYSLIVDAEIPPSWVESAYNRAVDKAKTATEKKDFIEWLNDFSLRNTGKGYKS